MQDDMHPGELPEEEYGDDELIEQDISEEERERTHAEWLSIARNTYQGSTDYLESSVRGQWETNIYNFRSRHAPEPGRSKKKMFRPKIRSSIRAHEAALAAALFTSNDLVSVEGANKNDPLQAASAKLNQALMQHRLDKSIPWFTTSVGAYQDTHVHGVCISKTYWDYEVQNNVEYMPLLDESGEFILDEEGNALAEEVVTPGKVLSDKPVIDLLAPENFRFDPNADWRDPVEDSPYLIEMIPMYAGDVLERMEQDDPKNGAPPWIEHTLAEILAAGGDHYDTDSTRQAREGDRQDPRDVSVDAEFRSVWVHFNIYRKDGQDWAFYTLGTSRLLSEPVPLEEYYKLGRETYRVGFSTIETHRNYPAGLAELGENLQNEINTLADQRYENVRLVLNKRYFIRRQGNVDLGALMRNVPGGGVMLDDPQNDVNVVSTPDVTSSSYAEQDRLNMDMDEMLGTFSPSTVQSNRSLNETVGGMNLMSSGANTVQEYMMRTFIETWVEPVLRTLVKLEQLFETDETILAIAAEKSGIKDQLAQAFGSPELLDQYIQQDMTVTVNVGMGNTNPEQKLKRLMLAVNTTSQMPEVAAKVNWDEVVKEIYGYAGFGDGGRFLSNQEGKEPTPQQPPPEVQIEQMKQQGRMQELQMKLQAEQQRDSQRLQVEAELGYARLENDRETMLIKLAEEKQITVEKLRTQLDIASSRDKTLRDTKALDASMKNREMSIKETLGTGI